MRERERVTGRGHTQAPDRHGQHGHTSVDGGRKGQQAVSGDFFDGFVGMSFRSRHAVGYFNGIFEAR